MIIHYQYRLKHWAPGGCTLDPQGPTSANVMERSTRQRAAILDALKGARRPLSSQEVLDAARDVVPMLGIATVYRNLKALHAAGDIMLVTLPGEAPRYEMAHAAHEHHHHFQCTQCQRVFDVHGCAGDFSTMAPPGFLVQGHEITLYGVCAECRGKGTAH